MTENKKKLRQQRNLRQVFELCGTSCLALTSFGAHNKFKGELDNLEDETGYQKELRIEERGWVE